MRANNKGCDYEESGEYAKAIECYQEAASAGFYGGMYNLGRCYYWGIGVPKNPSYAVSLMVEPARAGMREAQFVLGEAMTFGIGMRQDVRNGIAWLNLAASNGNRDARDLLQRIAYEQNRIHTEYWVQRAREAQQAAEAIEAQRAASAAARGNYRARRASKVDRSTARPEQVQPAVPDQPAQKQPTMQIPDKL